MSARRGATVMATCAFPNPAVGSTELGSSVFRVCVGCDAARTTPNDGRETVLEVFTMEGDSWRVEPLVCNELLTTGIWRVVTPEGSFIAKRLDDRRDTPVSEWHAHITANAQVPQHWSYWAREVLAYETSLPAAYAGSGIEGPTSLVVDRRPDRAELWLEDVDGRPGEEWDLDDYGAAAEALGRAHAPFLTGRPLPD